MNHLSFEGSLVVEIESINAFIEGKIYPLVIEEGQTAPYVAYESNEGLRLKTLAGYIDRKNISVDVHVVANTYIEMKHLASLAVEKIISFQSRAIGNDGPFIQDVVLSETKELFEEGPKLYRTIIPFQVYL